MVVTSNVQTGSNLVDYAFYLIQRGEAGHLRGCYTNQYKCSAGVETIGYGTVTRPGYNSLNYRETTITEEKAIELAKQEMAHKINEKCRSKFKDFDNLLPCYQAAILDTAYQGNWGSIQDAMNDHNMQAVYEAIINNPNKERSAVRGRAIEMGMMIEQALQSSPNADPRQVAQMLAQQMVEKYQTLDGTDRELTKDELALLYRSCMAAYGIEVTEDEIVAFAMGFENVASGMCGIGSEHMAARYNGVLASGPSYDGSRGGTGGHHGRSNHYSSEYSNNENYYAPTDRMPTPNAVAGDFPPDSDKLMINRDYTSPNRHGRSQKPSMIVLHSTECPTLSSAINTLAAPNPRSVSSHYLIARDGQIYQLVPENERANHAGESIWRRVDTGEVIRGCNSSSIGIEIQRSTNEGYTPEQIASTMALVKDIQERTGILPENTIGHADITPNGRKVDPGADFPWEAFAREGLVAGPRAGSGHEQHINMALNNVSSNDCKFYCLPDSMAFPDDSLTVDSEGGSLFPDDPTIIEGVGTFSSMEMPDALAENKTNEKSESVKAEQAKKENDKTLATLEEAKKAANLITSLKNAQEATVKAPVLPQEKTETTDQKPTPNSEEKSSSETKKSKPSKKPKSSKDTKKSKNSDKSDKEDKKEKEKETGTNKTLSENSEKGESKSGASKTLADNSSKAKEQEPKKEKISIATQKASEGK